MDYKLRVLFILAIVTLSCNRIPGLEVVERPRTEIVDEPVNAQVVATTLPEDALVATQNALNQQAQQQQAVETPAPPTAIPTIAPTPTPVPTTYFLQTISAYNPNNPDQLPRHGVGIVLLVLACVAFPWIAVQVWFIRYSLPRSIDLTEVLIRGKDGLFITAVLSMTARRTFTLTSLALSINLWSRIRSFVSTTLEQKLINEASKYETIDNLIEGMREITEGLNHDEIVDEIWTNFGVRVIRFNIETRYPPETMDALNRRAEATAGGQAYIAYANAAHLNPDSSESRELYSVYQRTTSQVDAARNLGGGIGNLAGMFGGQVSSKPKEGSSDDS